MATHCRQGVPSYTQRRCHFCHFCKIAYPAAPSLCAHGREVDGESRVKAWLCTFAILYLLQYSQLRHVLRPAKTWLNCKHKTACTVRHSTAGQHAHKRLHNHIYLSSLFYPSVMQIFFKLSMSIGRIQVGFTRGRKRESM